MKKVLTILMLSAGVVAGSTAASAVPYENSYSDYPEWAENAFISDN